MNVYLRDLRNKKNLGFYNFIVILHTKLFRLCWGCFGLLFLNGPLGAEDS